MVEGDLTTSQANIRTWRCPHDTGFVGRQNARVRDLERLTSKFWDAIRATQCMTESYLLKGNAERPSHGMWKCCFSCSRDLRMLELPGSQEPTEERCSIEWS